MHVTKYKRFLSFRNRARVTVGAYQRTFFFIGETIRSPTYFRKGENTNILLEEGNFWFVRQSVRTRLKPPRFLKQRQPIRLITYQMKSQYRLPFILI